MYSLEENRSQASSHCIYATSDQWFRDGTVNEGLLRAIALAETLLPSNKMPRIGLQICLNFVPCHSPSSRPTRLKLGVQLALFLNCFRSTSISYQVSANQGAHLLSERASGGGGASWARALVKSLWAVERAGRINCPASWSFDSSIRKILAPFAMLSLCAVTDVGSGAFRGGMIGSDMERLWY